MRASSLLLGAASSIAGLVDAQSAGYFTNFTTVTNSSLSFGKHYAVLNLDLINALVLGVANTTAGDAWIASTARWIDAVHAQSPPPLSIFSRIYFSNPKRPEIGPQTPFAAVAAQLPGNATEVDYVTQIYPAFNVDEDWDVVVQKSRYYAGFGNQLEEVLRSQLIDTVILSGIRTSGVILNTAYDLFNLNYKVYVIGENSIETAPDTAGIDQAIKQGILPKLPADVITLDQALAALNRSGPAFY